jgi:hypothetical protein
MKIVERLAVRSFTLRNLSLTGEPLRLFDVAVVLTTFSVSVRNVRSPNRVTSCTLFSSSPERVRTAKGAADKKGSTRNRWRRGQTLEGAGRARNPAPDMEELG